MLLTTLITNVSRNECVSNSAVAYSKNRRSASLLKVALNAKSRFPAGPEMASSVAVRLALYQKATDMFDLLRSHNPVLPRTHLLMMLARPSPAEPTPPGAHAPMPSWVAPRNALSYSQGLHHPRPHLHGSESRKDRSLDGQREYTSRTLGLD